MAKKQSPLQKAYQKFFRQKLRKYGVSSPAQLTTESIKKQFFTEVQEGWQKKRRRIRDPEQLKTRYTSRYLKHIKRRFNIGKMKLESGMLIELRYSTVDDRGLKKPPKKYFVLVLHPNWKKYMHALRLDFVSPKWTRELIENVGLVPCTVKPKCTKIGVQQLLLLEKNSRRFYFKELKKNMERKYNDSYRTFRLDRVSVLNLYFFDFSKFM